MPSKSLLPRIRHKSIIGKCAICGVERRMHHDHIIPRALGGTNAENNIQLLCANCHEDKTVKDSREIALALWQRPGYKEKRIAGAKAAWANPETRWRYEKGLKTLRGKPMSIETRAKISIAHKGKSLGPMSEEQKMKISAANKGRKVSDETKAKIRAAKIGKKMSIEARTKMSLSKRKHPELH